MKNLRSGAALVCGALLLLAGAPQSASAAPKPRIQIAFVLDTTGSMGGLIEGAKKKIWAIVNQTVSAKPQPEIEIGFVAYRDRGDAYVTQPHDLTLDLDKSFEILSKFRAEGGGDTPENVQAGLDDALKKLNWARAGSDNRNLYQAIFLVGDCPPHFDYNDGLDYKKSCAQASERGIFINTIRCGGDAQTEKIWLDIAKRGNGSYFSLAQDGGTVDVPTPYDDEIIRLGGVIENTTVARRGAGALQTKSYSYNGAAAASGGFGGSAGVAGKVSDEARENALNRATFNAKSAQIYSDFDVVTSVMNGRKVASLKNEELNDQMRAMTPAAREKWIAAKISQRKTAQARIAVLEKKRAAFVQAALKKQGAKGLDQKLVGSIRQQAQTRGFRY